MLKLKCSGMDAKCFFQQILYELNLMI